MFLCFERDWFDISQQHGDMNAGTKLAAVNKFRSPTSSIMRTSPTKVLVVYDIQVKTPEVSQIPLVVNYGSSSCPSHTRFLISIFSSSDLPKAVEEYAHRFVSLCDDIS
jgi:translation initiation factor 4A